MRVIFASLFFFLILNEHLKAQTYKQEQFAKVIAPVGINFRTSPTLNSKVIYKIPFLKSFKVIEYTEHTDSVKAHGFIDYQGNQTSIYLKGKWVKALYKGVIGYVYSSFISLNSNIRESDFDESFGLYFPGDACSVYVNSNPKIKWFGVYKEDSGFLIKKVQLLHYFGDGEISTFVTYVKSDIQPLFMFGTELDLKDNVQIKDSFRLGSFSKQENPDADLLSSEYKINDEGELLIVWKTLKQRIRTPVGKIESIQWKGDLDGDGIDDFIFDTGYGGSYILYLSSPTNDETILMPVAAFAFGICC
ncbi:SH3 domain-containing protein [Reichenbachiella versicolor]|uniref:SH3 domain-containing protein n=1 Tax=Reichenbachiella versicolor TaxID=1821036 RepID=UPI000D6DEA44|nr:SH3 domain-containing protein [Reichenbachiella versicolor]